MKINDMVRYIPYHANGDRKHADCENCTISSVKESGAFVKFDKQVSQLGWADTTAQKCYFDTLILL